MAEALLSLTITLLVLGGLVAAVAYGIFAVARRKRDFAETDPGIGTVRRLYFYAVAFVALMMAANGVVQTAVFVLDALFGPDVLSPSRARLATGLSLTIVGLPLWAVHWRIISKHVRELAVETRSVVRKVYAYVVLAVAGVAAVHAAISIIRALLGDDQDFSGYPWAALVVWGIVWAFHWRLEANEGQPTLETLVVRRLYVYSFAAGMLVVAALGVGQLVHIALLEAYESLTAAVLLGREAGLWQAKGEEALSVALVAGPVWAAHWLYFARQDYESTLRQLYLFALAIFGSVSTLLAVAGAFVYAVLVWTIGVPEEDSAVDHFRFIPPALASLITAGGILVYHALAAKADVSSYATAPQGGVRSYRYALNGLGFGPLAIGIVTLVALAVALVAERGEASILGQDAWRNTLSLSLTLVLLGLPLWGYYWSTIQRAVDAGDTAERAGLSRRIFIFAVLGVGMLALVGSVSFFIFVFLREVLDGELSRVLPDTKVSIGMIATAAIFVPYYWLVYRADRRALPAGPEEKNPERKAVTALVAQDGGGFLTGLEAALGYPVNPLFWTDPNSAAPELSETELRDLATRIGEAAGLNVLLVPEGTEVRVLSYR